MTWAALRGARVADVMGTFGEGETVREWARRKGCDMKISIITRTVRP